MLDNFGFVTHTLAVSIAQLPFLFLYSSPFSRDPLADVWWAILEPDAVGFAVLKKTDNALVHQPQVFQVQDNVAIVCLCAD